VVAADIKAMIAKHGADGVAWLAKDIPGRAAKELSDKLTVDVPLSRRYET
jgi:hypothetical protein